MFSKMIFYPKICWFTRFVVNCRESNLRTFCRQIHQWSSQFWQCQDFESVFYSNPSLNEMWWKPSSELYPYLWSDLHNEYSRYPDNESKYDAKRYKHQCWQILFCTIQKCDFMKNESVQIIEATYIPLPRGHQRKKRYSTAILKRFPSCCSINFKRGR